MKRATRNASLLFRRVLTQAEEHLALSSKQAANFEHKGVRGNERAAALADFLSLHLPGVFAVGKGEARDYRDNVTGELDLIVYDRSTAAPIQTGSDNLIVPAEALYAVIEVKSVLSQAELDICLGAAMKVRSLQPFKKQFIASPTEGRVEKDHYRCPYLIFAYSSNLGPGGWAAKEYKRLINTSQKIGCPPDVVDRLIVIDRGIIGPQMGAAGRFAQCVSRILPPLNELPHARAKAASLYRLDRIHFTESMDEAHLATPGVKEFCAGSVHRTHNAEVVERRRRRFARRPK